MENNVCNEAAEEITRLREDNERLTQQLVVTTVNSNRKLQGEVERLRELLSQVVSSYDGTAVTVEAGLCNRIEREVSDE